MKCHRWSTATAVAALMAAAGCDNDRVTAPTPPGPVPGRLIVSLDTTAGPVGAVLVKLRGVGITTPTPSSAAEHVFVLAVDSVATVYRIAVVGERLSGALFSFAVPDITRLDAYSTTVLEIADRENRLQIDFGGYHLFVLREQDSMRSRRTPSPSED